MKLEFECFDEIRIRGLINQCTVSTDELKNLLNRREKSTFYLGFDPTSNSLHIGHLLPIFLGIRLLQFGHGMIILIGGATGKIGDPSGRNKERPELDEESITRNVNSIKEQIKYIIGVVFNGENIRDENGNLLKIIDKDSKPLLDVNGKINENDNFFINPRIAEYHFNINNLFISRDKSGDLIFVDNNEWFSKKKYCEFLNEIGRFINVNKMLSMDSIKNRLERGLSFLEFNYMIMQAFDFLYLRKKYGCNIQIGGQDQWCNIVMGIDLIKSKRDNQYEYDDETVCGLTLPLLLDSGGRKFGKTNDIASDIVNNLFWLRFCITSIGVRKKFILFFFNFWRNVEDKKVVKLLYLFTFLPVNEIKKMDENNNSLKTTHKTNRLKEILAYELVKICFSKDEADSVFIFAKNSSNERGRNKEFDPSNLLETSSCIRDVDIHDEKKAIDMYNDLELSRKSLSDRHILPNFMFQQKLCSSIGEAKRLIKGGAVDINGNNITDILYSFSFKDSIEKGGFYIIKIRVGKQFFYWKIKKI